MYVNEMVYVYYKIDKFFDVPKFSPYSLKKKNLSLLEAVEAHRVVKGREAEAPTYV
jgi:hypothetical protein